LQWNDRAFVNRFTTPNPSNRAGGLRELDGTARWESYADTAIAYAIAESFEVLHVVNQTGRLTHHLVSVTIIRPVGAGEHTLRVGFGPRYITRISLPRGPGASFDDSFPSLRKDMLNVGRPFDLVVPQPPHSTATTSDRLHGYFIATGTAGNEDGGTILAVLNIYVRLLVNPASVELGRRIAAHFDDPRVSDTPYEVEDMILALLNPAENAKQRFKALRRLCPGVSPGIPDPGDAQEWGAAVDIVRGLLAGSIVSNLFSSTCSPGLSTVSSGICALFSLPVDPKRPRSSSTLSSGVATDKWAGRNRED
jgi:hypothetical protein